MISGRCIANYTILLLDLNSEGSISCVNSLPRENRFIIEEVRIEPEMPQNLPGTFPA